MLKLRDIMTSDVLTVAPNVSVREAAELFATERMSGAPVVHNGRILGMISASDLLDFIAALPAEPAEVRASGERGILDDHTVEEAMTRGELVSLPPDAPAARAAELMKEKRIHRLAVVENDRLVGIVSTLDLVKAVADGRISHRTFVFPKHSDVV